jgi:hypothetical protein
MIEGLQADLKNLGISLPVAGAETKKQNNLAGAFNALDALCQWRETEVELPLLGIKVLVKPIKGLEEMRIKSLKASGETFIKTFNQILFEHIDFQGQVEFKDLNDFMSHLGAADKSAIVYGLVFATYTSLGEREFECPHCSKKQVYDIRPDELLQPDTFGKKWDKPGLFTDFRDVITVVPGFDITIGFSTEQDSINILSIIPNNEIKENLSERSELLNTLKIFIMFIKDIKIKTPDGDIILTDLKEEIYPFIMGLQNVNILESLIDKLSKYEEFNQYNPKFYAIRNCNSLECGKEFRWMVNPEIEMFRKASLFFNI